MDIKWYYVKNKDRVGPIGEEELLSLLSNGTLSEESYVWKKGFVNWIKVKETSLLEQIQSQIDTNEEVIEADTSTEADTSFEAETSFDDIETSQEADTSFEENTRTEVINKTPYYEKYDHHERLFYLKVNPDSNIYGPYSIEILKILYQEKRFYPNSLLFTFYEKNWKSISKFPFYKEIFGENDKIKNESDSLENSMHAPLYGQILTDKDPKDTLPIHHKTGLCRDLTIGGTQILIHSSLVTSDLIGKKISIRLTQNLEDKGYYFEGEVVRVLEGLQGVFIRFQFSKMEILEKLELLNQFIEKQK